MAQYKHLPIYKASYDMLLRIVQVSKDFPREYRFTIGQNLEKEAIELIVSIYKANNAKNKADFIKTILEHIQIIDLLLRISHDIHILPRNHYATIVEMTDNLAKQSKGWLASLSGKNEPESIQATAC